MYGAGATDPFTTTDAAEVRDGSSDRRIPYKLESIAIYAVRPVQSRWLTCVIEMPYDLDQPFDNRVPSFNVQSHLQFLFGISF